MDVNNDGAVTPVDALILINALNFDGGSRPLGARPDPPDGETPQALPFLDVNGDHELTAVDALLIINQLNAQAEAATDATTRTRAFRHGTSVLTIDAAQCTTVAPARGETRTAWRPMPT